MKLKQLMNRIALIAATAGAVLGWASSANATILVDQASPYGGYSVGGADWGAFTAALGSQPGGYTVGSVGNAADVAAASAILIVTRDNNFGTNNSLSATETANLTSFLATGGRVAILGEGNFWNLWNNSILAFASGGTASSGAVYSGNSAPVVANELTAGVGSILLQGAGTTNGGMALFGQNFATLWGDNLLTVLDANAFQTFPAPAFRDNVASWLGHSTPTAAVPEPTSWAMMLIGFGLIGSGIRRAGRQTRPIACA